MSLDIYIKTVGEKHQYTANSYNNLERNPIITEKRSNGQKCTYVFNIEILVNESPLVFVIANLFSPSQTNP